MSYCSSEEITRGKIKFQRREVIGRTSSSTIFKGTFEGKIDVAVKRISHDSAELAEKEINVLLVKADHINVVRYFCRERDDDFCYIAMELCKCSLEEYVEKKGNYLRHESNLPNTPVEQILLGAAEGLSHIHKNDIIHRDVKPSNILLFVKGDKLVAKISDFSLSRIIPDNQTVWTNVSAGTDLFKAPKLLPTPFSWRCDVYNFGLVIFYVFSKGKHLFNNNPSLIIKGKPVNLEELKRHPAALSLIKWLTASNQEERPRMSEVVHHPFFWDDEKKLNFIRDVHQVIEDRQYAFLKEVIEEDSHHVICSSPENCGNQRSPPDLTMCDWSRSLTSGVKADLPCYVKTKSCAELIRLITNKLTHFYDLKEAVKAEYGGSIKGFHRYWLDRFPSLVVHLWEKVEITHLAARFSGYYASESVRRKNLETTLQQKQQQQTVSPPIQEFTSQYLNTFETIKLLGRGGFGVVFQVRHRVDDRHYAVKVIPLRSSDEDREKSKREVSVLAELNHEHIVRYHNSFVESPPPGWQEQGDQQWMHSKNFTGFTFNDGSNMCLYIQMELCKEESLRDWIKANVPHKDSFEVVRMFSQIVQAVEYVHSKNLIHRDLKPSNIFFASDGRIKIGDFGLVTAKTEDPGRSRSQENPYGTSAYTPLYRLTENVGTRLYMSPEQLEEEPYNYKVDIYSLGLIFFELLWPLRTKKEHFDTLTQLESLEFPHGFAEKHIQEHELLKKMLSSNPDERPTASEVLRSPPLANYQDDRSTTLRST